MRILGLLFLVVVGAILFVNWRDANIKRQEAERARAEAMVAEMQGVDAAKAAMSTPGPGRTDPWDPVTKRYVGQESNVSVTQSRGAGGSNDGRPSAGRKATAGEEARKQFGWDGKGTALDKPATR